MSILDIREPRRRFILPVVGLVLAAYFFFVLQRFTQSAESLDAPLNTAWRKLAIAVGESNATTLDLKAVGLKLQQTEQALAVLREADQQAAARVALGADLREHLSSRFQLVDFQNEVQKQISDLSQLAKQQKVTLAPTVSQGFPEHTADVKQPELLWAELAFVDDLLTLALNSKVTAIHTLTLPLTLTNAPPMNHPLPLAEVPVQLELSGSMSSVTRFLESLPLRTEEIKAQGLPEAPTNKPALFIDRVLLRKEAPEKPDEVRLFLRAVGFVFRE